jgi:hypothetical protein
MNAKRDVGKEIEEIKGRTGPPDWDNGLTKLLFLSTQVKKLTDETEECLYYPVACVAALEVYFRWEVRNLIDSGDPRFIRNIRIDELAVRVDHDLLIAIHGQRLTVGDLVAHFVKLSHFDAVNKALSQLLQADFIDLVKTAREPEDRRTQGENAPPIISSISDVLTKVKRTFNLRHVVCHEAHLRTTVNLAEIKDICSACYEFARASRYAIAHYENPNAPLTLDEAYNAALERVKVLKAQLKNLEDLVVSNLGQAWITDAFLEMQRAWKLSVEKQAGYDAAHHMNGNRSALYEQLTTEEMYKKRLVEMKKYSEDYANNSVSRSGAL